MQSPRDAHSLYVGAETTPIALDILYVEDEVGFAILGLPSPEGT